MDCALLCVMDCVLCVFFRISVCSSGSLCVLQDLCVLWTVTSVCYGLCSSGSLCVMDCVLHSRSFVLTLIPARVLATGHLGPSTVNLCSGVLTCVFWCSCARFCRLQLHLSSGVPGPRPAGLQPARQPITGLPRPHLHVAAATQLSHACSGNGKSLAYPLAFHSKTFPGRPLSH